MRLGWWDAVLSVTIWDLPGREDVDLRQSYYKDVDAGIGINVNVFLKTC